MKKKLLFLLTAFFVCQGLLISFGFILITQIQLACITMVDARDSLSEQCVPHVRTNLCCPTSETGKGAKVGSIKNRTAISFEVAVLVLRRKIQLFSAINAEKYTYFLRKVCIFAR